MKSLIPLFLLAGCALAQFNFTDLAFMAQSGGSVSGGSGGSTITNVPTLFWWKNSSLVGSDGVMFTNWVDSSTNSHPATNSTSSGPYLTNNVDNGKTAARFVANTFLQSMATGSVPYTIAGVMRTDSSNSNHRAITTGVLADNCLISFDRGSSSLTVYLNNEVSDFSPLTNVAHVFILSVQTDGAFYWVDGTNRTKTTGFTNAWRRVDMGNVTFGEDSLHYVYEVMGWTNSMTTNQLNGIGQYLTNIAGRWAAIP